jgi:sorting nexin-8
MSPDQAFLEQRRKGLQRFMNFVVNHPILKEDGCLGVFLAEPNFEGWRKRSKVNLDEESSQKKLDQASEASIPQDVTQRIDTLRRQLPTLLEAHARLVVLSEKSIRRIEAASADQSRMAMTMATLSESCPQSCWRNADSGATPGGIGGAGCDLCKGVGRGLAAVGDAWGREAEDAERRTMALTLGAIESLKTQRDLYASFKDLLARHDRTYEGIIAAGATR